MKIFITGATGFIGKNLVKRIEPKGHEISCLVRESSKIDSLKQLNVNLVTGDITDYDCIEKCFQEIKPDMVFHCAAKIMSTNKKELFSHNVIGTRNMCEASYITDVKRMIHLSSVAVVSETSYGLISDDLEYTAVNKYSESKIEAECLVKNYREKGLNAVIIRPCMVYGEDEPHLLDKLLSKARKHLLFLPNIPGVLSKTNLVSVDNVIDVLELAMYKTEALEGTFIVADSEILTIKKVFEIFQDEIDGTEPKMIPKWISEIVLSLPYYRKRRKFFKNRIHDIRRLRKILGYEPKVKTEDGLRQIVRAWKIKQQTGVKG